MWLAFLPFSLWDACHWVTIPASGIIAFLLLGIEEIGVQIEEPFGILPLGAWILFHTIGPDSVIDPQSFDCTIQQAVKGVGVWPRC